MVKVFASYLLYMYKYVHTYIGGNVRLPPCTGCFGCILYIQ